MTHFMDSRRFFRGLLGSLMIVMLVVSEAWAGGDSTFAPLVTLVQGWMQGSLGTLLALVGALFGLGAAMASRWSGLAIGFGVAAGAFYIPDIIPVITTGTM
ncbi:MAG: hypothetical protein NPIRA01_40710 [Nitrospirales bacterium]|nr:MAG: hypothetical protein NPIRA01_40710 [Nitrospirales bacterium]